MLDIPHYKKNICLKRLYSNVVFSNNVYKYLKQRRKPDVVYCAIPSVILASKVGKYCKKIILNLLSTYRIYGLKLFKWYLIFPC